MCVRNRLPSSQIHPLEEWTFNHAPQDEKNPERGAWRAFRPVRRDGRYLQGAQPESSQTGRTRPTWPREVRIPLVLSLDELRQTGRDRAEVFSRLIRDLHLATY